MAHVDVVHVWLGGRLDVRSAIGSGDSMTELVTAKDLRNRYEDLRERLLAELRANAFAIHHDEIVRSPKTEMEYIERIDRAETSLAAANERIAQLETRHVRFMVEGGPVVMAAEYDKLKAENEQLKSRWVDWMYRR